MDLLALWLSWLFPSLWIAESSPWSAPGGHATRCLHKRMQCVCESCIALIAACKRCQKRLAKQRKELPRARDDHGRWL